MFNEKNTNNMTYYHDPIPAEKVTSLGKDWHRPCLKCEKCKKVLTSGSHAEVIMMMFKRVVMMMMMIMMTLT